MKVFSDSASLNAFVRDNNVVTWHGDYGMGNLLFIDSPDLHVVFFSRAEYEKWRAADDSLDLQICFF